MKFRIPLHRRDDEAAPRTPRTHAARSAEQEEARVLERAAGNRTTLRLLGQRPAEGVEAEAPFGAHDPQPGRPLEAGVRRRMESAIGADLGDVRVHTDESAASEVRRHGAEAFALGRHVAFEHGRYRPGTPVGDAILAHELAHVVQQRAGRDGGGGGAPGHRLEADANRSAMGAVGALWGGVSRAAGRAAAGAGPRLASGTQMQFFFCESEPAFETPSYMGPHSRETIRNLNRRLGALEALGPLIAVGTAVTIGLGPPSDPSDTVVAAAEALRGLPQWARAIIAEEVTWLQLQHGNDLNAQEREFWDAVMREMNAP